MRNAIGSAAVCVLALAASAATAQTIYKLIDPQGLVIYSDHVIPGMRVVDKLVPPPPPDPELIAAARAAEAERAQRANALARARVQALDAAAAKVRTAEARLAAAKQALEAGIEPLPGERLGTVRRGGGGEIFSRYSDAYWHRISALEQAVGEATKQLELAYSERNALRD